MLKRNCQKADTLKPLKCGTATEGNSEKKTSIGHPQPPSPHPPCTPDSSFFLLGNNELFTSLFS